MSSGSKRAAVSPQRLRAIAELAGTVADCRNPKNPVEPSTIAKANDISVSFNAYGGSFDGLLEHRNGRFHIYCNLDRVEFPDSPRARFTLGHELGHFYLDEHRLALESGQVPSHPSFCEYESVNEVEVEADHFAANLLMPEARFRREARNAPVGLSSILTLRKVFATSVTSTAIRYASLEIAPCAVVKWTTDRVAWSWLSSGTREAGLRRTIKTTDRVIEGSATAKAFSGEAPPDSDFFKTGTTVSEWFPSVARGSWRNAILIEEALTLGRFGVLTFLRPDGGKFPWAD